MPPPLDPAKREAIADAIRAGGTRNAIARDHDVSPSTVTGIAKTLEADEPGVVAFDRSATKTATAARSTDLAGRKAHLAELLMQDAFDLRGRIWDEQVVGHTGSGEDREPVMALPGGRDVQAFMTAIGIAIDKVAALTRDDAQGLAAVDSWLRSLGVAATPA